MALLTGFAVMELKFGGRVPAVFKEVVEAFALEPRRWSKYRTAAESLGLVPSTGNGAPCATHA
jgi:hypothetical protein